MIVFTALSPNGEKVVRNWLINSSDLCLAECDPFLAPV